MNDENPLHSSPDMVTVDVEIACADWRQAVPDPAKPCREAACAALAAAGLGGRNLAIEVGVRLTDDAEQRALNSRHRGIDRPTNVLSFPAADCVAGELPESAAHGAPVLLGDVVVAWETVRGEAASHGLDVRDHLRHLVVHGVLHLAGFDHEIEADAEAMERLEASALAGLGVANPYAVPYAVSEPGTEPGRQK